MYKRVAFCIIVFFGLTLQNCSIHKHGLKTITKISLCKETYNTSSSYITVYATGESGNAEMAKEKAMLELKQLLLVQLNSKLKSYFISNTTQELQVPSESLNDLNKLILINNNELLANIACEETLITEGEYTVHLVGTIEIIQMVGRLKKLSNSQYILPPEILPENILDVISHLDKTTE